MITLNKNLQMIKLVCIKEFHLVGNNIDKNYCIIGKTYDYWINFGGLNHFIKLESGQPFPFKGPYGNDNETCDSDEKVIWVDSQWDIDGGNLKDLNL